MFSFSQWADKQINNVRFKGDHTHTSGWNFPVMEDNEHHRIDGHKPELYVYLFGEGFESNTDQLKLRRL